METPNPKLLLLCLPALYSSLVLVTAADGPIAPGFLDIDHPLTITVTPTTTITLGPKVAPHTAPDSSLPLSAAATVASTAQSSTGTVTVTKWATVTVLGTEIAIPTDTPGSKEHGGDGEGHPVMEPGIGEESAWCSGADGFVGQVDDIAGWVYGLALLGAAAL